MNFGYAQKYCVFWLISKNKKINLWIKTWYTCFYKGKGGGCLIKPSSSYWNGVAVGTWLVYSSVKLCSSHYSHKSGFVRTKMNSLRNVHQICSNACNTTFQIDPLKIMIRNNRYNKCKAHIVYLPVGWGWSDHLVVPADDWCWLKFSLQIALLFDLYPFWLSVA